MTPSASPTVRDGALLGLHASIVTCLWADPQVPHTDCQSAACLMRGPHERERPRGCFTPVARPPRDAAGHARDAARLEAAPQPC